VKRRHNLLAGCCTAAQIDCPPHMMPPLESGLPNAGYWGSMTCDKVPVWQFLGEVVRVDGRKILDQEPNGVSPTYTTDMIRQVEPEIGRSVGPSDAVLYFSTGAATTMSTTDSASRTTPCAGSAA
jgi:hypothetical protein